MSFIAELRQRRVFRVAMVYLVVAWVAIQAASIALPAFDAPPWALRVVILLFALGFPLALLLTWVLDMTPEGIRVATGKVGNTRMAGIAAGLVALALGWYFLGQPALRQQAIAGERSIAVLPFVNMSGDKANEYFSDGLAETTLDMLAQVKDLKVIARTSSFAFKGRNEDVRTIGKALGAAHLLEGSVQQAGDTVRITVQLIRTSDGAHLWSQRYDRKLADIFRIQDEIATEVVKALQLALPAAAQRHLLRKRTENVAAYDEYLKGMALLPQRNNASLREALRHFERAIQLDPGYARAYAMAGTATGLLRTYGGATRDQERKLVHFIDRALELAPDLGEAHVARGAQLEWAGELAGAERAYKRGIELAPGYATGYQWLGELYGDQTGEIDKALPLLERAMALDPLSPILQKEYAQALAKVRRLDDAERVMQRLLQAHPGFAPGYEMLAQLREQSGDLSGALRAIDEAALRDPEMPFYAVGRCRALLEFNAMDEARGCMERYIRAHPGERAREARARVLQMDGKFEEALELHASGEQPDPFLTAYLLMGLGRMSDAEAVLRNLPPEKLAPGLFRTPPNPASPYVEDPLVVGVLRLHRGDSAGGTALIAAAARQAAARPLGSGTFARGWWDAIALAQLGRLDDACAAFRASVDAGHFTGLAQLRADPLAAPLRKQPCYEDILAKAHALALAEVEKARAAGLLQPALNQPRTRQ